MAYEDFKDLPRRIVTGKVLRNKSFNIAKYPKYDGYQHELASMIYNFFDRKTSFGAVKREVMPNQQLSEELPKPIIRKLEKQKVNSSFLDNIWGADLAYMKLISKSNKGFLFLLHVIDI